MNAIDADAGQNAAITYWLDEQSKEAMHDFQIESDTGWIVTRRPFDRELEPHFETSHTLFEGEAELEFITTSELRRAQTIGGTFNRRSLYKKVPISPNLDGSYVPWQQTSTTKHYF
ncbi:unnamed protein product [Protopolystoma xenopodis]|uniref:Cadherin domain-containing protein n=1 Tax=Protopolystoma xenopodis TaxID=117903 RepID=A0A3S5C479_9PLAT|nr:unnamed protein product [Protopolystoma xenopodis]